MPIKCDRCGKDYETQNEYDLHLQKDKLKCDYCCRKTFETRCLRDTHIKESQKGTQAVMDFLHVLDNPTIEELIRREELMKEYDRLCKLGLAP